MPQISTFPSPCTSARPWLVDVESPVYSGAAARRGVMDDLRALGPVLGKPDGPILLDCKVNADIAAPFMGEFAEFEARHQST